MDTRTSQQLALEYSVAGGDCFAAAAAAAGVLALSPSFDVGGRDGADTGAKPRQPEPGAHELEGRSGDHEGVRKSAPANLARATVLPSQPREPLEYDMPLAGDAPFVDDLAYRPDPAAQDTIAGRDSLAGDVAQSAEEGLLADEAATAARAEFVPDEVGEPLPSVACGATPIDEGAHSAAAEVAAVAAIDRSPEAHDAGDVYAVNGDTAAHGPEDAARARIHALVERTQAARSTSDTDLLMQAYAFACEKHEGQTRLTGEPYIEHPVAVAGILAELGMDDLTLAAGLLHDVPEDCNVPYEEMVARFGSEVAQLVDGVTKLKKIEFSSKEEKQAENLRKLFLAMSNDIRVIIIKLADRLHNMRTLDPFPEPRRREIAAETLHFFAPIAHRLGIWRIKWELEDRSFKFLEPEAYKSIYTKVQRTRAERTALVQQSSALLRQRLQAEGIEAEVSGRPKHFYSIYHKMISQGIEFNAIHDLIALRVICPEVRDCYHALGIVHSMWSQVPDKFSDYIGKPKANNYQSLHTKVLGPNSIGLEVQIRTRDMHREAEYGIAAHWRYKQGKRTEAKFGDKLRWLRMVLELESDTKDNPKAFLDSLRLDLSSELFAFTPKGDVVDLRRGSTPVDFAYRVHSEIGHHCIGATVNGRIVPLSFELHSGDIVEIQTSRSSKGPSLGWLDFVVDSHAKNRIKNFFRRQNFDENHRRGTERLEKAARVSRLRLEGEIGSGALAKQARLLKYKSVAELVAAIGYGEHSPESILNRIKADLKEEGVPASADVTLSGAATSLLHRRLRTRDQDGNELSQGSLVFGFPAQRKHKRKGANSDQQEMDIDMSPQAPPASTDVRSEVIAQNSVEAPVQVLPKPPVVMQSGLQYTISKCCAPIPGDEVRGYITRGRGITVHRADCLNLKHYEQRDPARLVEAQWTTNQSLPSNALVAIEAIDRVGLLSDVTTLMRGRNINICGSSSYPLKNNRARINIAVTILNVQELSDVMQALRSVGGVTDVHRV